MPQHRHHRRCRVARACVAGAFLLHSLGMAQPNVPESSLYQPKPSQDISWAVGNWVAATEHPVQGRVHEWSVSIHANGQYFVELRRDRGAEPQHERGVWVTVEREIWSFTAIERNRNALDQGSLAPELYTILAIYPSALELRHMGSGKVLRLARASI